MSHTLPPVDRPRWTRRHLLGLQDLSADEIRTILAEAARFKERSAGGQKMDDLRGVTVANLFFEPSTRTKTSFSLAAKRLGADTVDFTASTSSLTKGETFLDTALTIQAMGVQQMVVRHSTSGTPALLAANLDCSVLNAGDGTHEHPTQGLLDIFTIQERKGPDFSKLTVTLVGDIKHSRVARSNIWGLTKLGARVIMCGPPTLVPTEFQALGVEIRHNFDDVLEESDCVNLLRVQFERQRGAFFPSISEYAHLYAMTEERLNRAPEDVVVLAPGPINRGVEITPSVADGPNSVILNQVSNGLVVRMACMALLKEAVAG